VVSDFAIFCCIVLINKSDFTISIWWLIQSRTLSYAMILNWEFLTYIWSVKLCNTQKLQVRIEYPSFHLKGLIQFHTTYFRKQWFYCMDVIA
jgi:hypothetical protein